MTNTEIEHAGPHIPKIQWEQIYGGITNTTLTTFIFLIFIIIFAIKGKIALNKPKSRLKIFLITTIRFFDNFLKDSFHDKAFARKHFMIVVWIFTIILFWNLFGLVIDWLIAAVPIWIEAYLRPINSDVNTTLVLALIAISTFLYIAIKTHSSIKVAKWYFFNYTWHSVWEKLINVFAGWLHLIGIPSSIISLSLRLFGNIFAWIILIWVITFLGIEVTKNIHLFELWRMFSLPFWFFELFVAFLQTVVFTGLMITYFNQSKEEHH